MSFTEYIVVDPASLENVFVVPSMCLMVSCSQSPFHTLVHSSLSCDFLPYGFLSQSVKSGKRQYTDCL